MKILLAQEYGTHPFWGRNSYEFIIIDTDTLTAGRASRSFLRTKENNISNNITL